MSVFYARGENANGEKETVVHHLQRTGELCSEFLDPIGYGDWGRIIGQLHDFGKISPLFQEVLAHKRVGVNHALPGAVAVDSLKKCRSYLQPVIACHHDKLKNAAILSTLIRRAAKGEGDRYDLSGREISLFGQAELAEAFSLCKKYFQAGKVLPPPDFSADEDSSLSKMLFTRMLYSALIDADWSASAEHFEKDYLQKHTGPVLDAPAAYSRLLELLDNKRLKSTAEPALNSLRDNLFDDCCRAGDAPSGLFTLTAPTGLGKTLSLTAFALRHAMQTGKRRIIILMPYLSIIEQNAIEYRHIFPELIEIHSHANQTEETAELFERWDAPCIVTTNVSFFEPLFSDAAGDCRHLHQFADSIIILDEAQTLPGELLNASLRTLKEFCARYNCTVVLSTATQPSYNYRPGLSWQPTEIVQNKQALFDATRRVNWQWAIDTGISMKDLAAEIARYSQCAVILNMKRHTHSLLCQLREICPEQNLFFLTTELSPAHRSDMLAEVRQRLQSGEPCILVATQCIEAGVDLDFPVVYRALAPLDSIIQAGGRCNRNGKSMGLVKIFLPDEPGMLYPTAAYGKAAQCVKTLLSRHPIDCSNLEHIEEYYSLLYFSDSDKKELQKAISQEDYQEVAKEYKMITKEGVQIIVPYKGRQEQYQQVKELYEQEGLSRKLIKLAKDITVSSFDRNAADQYCRKLYYYNRRRERQATNYYLLELNNFYDDKTGLDFQASFDGFI